MDFSSLLYDFIIGPIELIVNFVFLAFSEKIGGGGIAIMGVSLVVNLLALPLYNVADKIQQKERDLQQRLQPRVKRIKEAFKGDEQSMILATYYRQNGYHPLYSLRNSFSILIQIPFFMAAYNYLSSCDELKGAGFLFLKNLGEPDRLLSLGGDVAVNLLPIIMTLINVISGLIYSKGFPVKDKIQIFGLAGIFLILLYNSPSGLVFYWILNNLFSLGKNIVLKMKNPGQILHRGICAGLFAVSIFFWVAKPEAAFAKKAIFTAFALCVLIFPKVFRFFGGKVNPQFFQIKSVEEKKTYFHIFVLSCLVLAVTLGLLLPASTIGTSPVEFSFLGDVTSPTYYIWHCFALMLGLFLFYPLCFYKMFGFNEKKVAYIFLILTLCVLANIYLFKHDYGLFDTAFQLEDREVLASTSGVNRFGPIALLFTAVVILYLGDGKFFKLKNHLATLMLAILLGEVALSCHKLVFIKSDFKKLVAIKAENDILPSEEIQPVFNLSKTEKNVIVLFIDRGISAYFPYTFEEFPELKEAYSGFTYFPNCLSYSTNTMLASPPMVGGYDYTPEEMNKRSDTLLVDKHNEALMLMPKLFSDANYDVVVADTPWTNYFWTPDFTPFREKIPEVKTHILTGQYNSNYIKTITKIKSENAKTISDSTKQQLPFFALVQSIYPPLRLTVYDITRFPTPSYFSDCFSTLYFLPQLTDFTNEDATYSFIGNDTA
ncbi:MAG: membrane protein insertase YidC, partial [Spirochaetaceae bacterium]|nr:membrane protein insertase YidC [Spirochaetaceae bacterium]